MKDSLPYSYKYQSRKHWVFSIRSASINVNTNRIFFQSSINLCIPGTCSPPNALTKALSEPPFKTHSKTIFSYVNPQTTVFLLETFERFTSWKPYGIQQWCGADIWLQFEKGLVFCTNANIVSDQTACSTQCTCSWSVEANRKKSFEISKCWKLHFYRPEN